MLLNGTPMQYNLNSYIKWKQTCESHEIMKNKTSIIYYNILAYLSNILYNKILKT